MAGTVDITHGRECEVLTDVEVLMAKEQEPLGDQVALHDHQRVLLCHLGGESTRVRPWQAKHVYRSYGGQGGRDASPTGHLEVRRTEPLSLYALHGLNDTSVPNTCLGV